MRSWSSNLLPVLLLGSGLCFAGNLWAQTTEQQLMRQGEALGKKGDYPAALSKFQQSQRLSPQPVKLCHLGLTYARMTYWHRALHFFQLCRKGTGRRFPDWAKRELELAKSKVLAGRFAQVEITTSPPDTSFTLSCFATDTVFYAPTKVFVPFGSHEVVVKKQGYQPASEHLLVRSKSPYPVYVPLLRVRGQGGPAMQDPQTLPATATTLPEVSRPPPTFATSQAVATLNASKTKTEQETRTSNGVPLGETSSEESQAVAPPGFGPWQVAAAGVVTAAGVAAVTGTFFLWLTSDIADRAARSDGGSDYDRLYQEFQAFQAAEIACYVAAAVLAVGGGALFLVAPGAEESR